MRGRWFVGIAVGMLVFTTALTVRLAWELIAPAAPVVAQDNCREVETFTGDGIKQTPPFEVQSDTWKIVYEWQADPQNPDFGLFNITVNNADNNQFETIISKEQPGRDESFVNAGAGRYYLEVGSANATWTVTVQDCGTPDEQPPVENPPVEEDPEVGQYEEPEFTQPVESGELIEAGGSADGPVPVMPGGTCPTEFPTLKAGACY